MVKKSKAAMYARTATVSDPIDLIFVEQPSLAFTNRPQSLDSVNGSGFDDPHVSDLAGPEQPKAFAVPADDGRGFDDKDAGLPVVPDRAQPGPQQSIGRGQFRSFDGALQNTELMAESENLKLECRTAPEGSANSGRESRQ
jgi:hypothetical protein